MTCCQSSAICASTPSRGRDIVLLLDAIRDRGAVVVANRALAVTRRMFAFAVERGVIEISPFTGVRASRETPRARILSDDELRRLWAATAPAARGSKRQRGWRCGSCC